MADEDLERAVSAQLRELLDDRGISGNQLAKMTGLEQTTIARKLRGPRAFSLKELNTICGALGVKLPELIEWAQQG